MTWRTFLSFPCWLCWALSSIVAAFVAHITLSRCVAAGLFGNGLGNKKHPSCLTLNWICEIETRRGQEMRANLAQALWCWSQRCGEKQPMPSPFAWLTSLLYWQVRVVEMFSSSNRIEVRHPTLRSQRCGTWALFWTWRMPVAVACDPAWASLIWWLVKKKLWTFEQSWFVKYIYIFFFPCV